MAGIRIEHVTKVFGRDVRAVDDVDLTIEDGEFVVLLGPSGCGKTTLLRMIAGLEVPTRGRVHIGGRDITDLPPRRRDLAMVFQSYAVFPHLTAFDNIAFGLRMRGESRATIREKVERVAVLVELQDHLDRHPSQLSGGQRQRVAVARAVVMEPSVLLMDEPLSNLDALLRLHFRAELKRLVRELNTTTVYVTHDQVEALSLGDRIAVMRQGRVVQFDTPTVVYDQPASRFVGSFIGNPPMNLLPGQVSDGQLRVGGHAVLSGVAARSGEVIVGIRAENIELVDGGDADGTVPVTVDVVEPLGSHLLVTADLGGSVVKLQAPSDAPITPGERLSVRLQADKLRLYDPDTEERLTP